jgi:hypothetical protein
VGGAALLGTVGPNRDLGSEGVWAADEGSEDFALGLALDGDAADDVVPAVAPAVTTSDGLRRNIHAITIRSTIANERINPIRVLLRLGFCGAVR